jgi:hypothetical protein
MSEEHEAQQPTNVRSVERSLIRKNNFSIT